VDPSADKEFPKEEINPFLLFGIDVQLGCPACSLVTVSTELSQLPNSVTLSAHYEPLSVTFLSDASAQNTFLRHWIFHNLDRLVQRGSPFLPLLLLHRQNNNEQCLALKRLETETN
jgi:hypothetical protein